MPLQKALPGEGHRSSRWTTLLWSAMILFFFSAIRTLSSQPDAGGAPHFPVEGAICKVEVIGEVMKPGAYPFPSGATVADAVSAAGGAMQSADLKRLNLSARLLSGSVLRVPNRQTGFLTTVSLSRSSLWELCTLPGIGPKLAKRIIAAREKQGPFRDVDDLLAVPGIGLKKARSILRRGVLQ